MWRFLGGTHEGNTQLTKPINLTPLANWLNNNKTVYSLSSFLERTHSNSYLTKPIDLTPISNWFADNTAMDSLGYFLEETHSYNPQITEPIDLTPLSNWFNTYKPPSHPSFMYRTHYNITSNLNLTGQTIFPDWVKWIMIIAGDMENADENSNCPSFFFCQTFYVETTKTNDTGEPKFEDGSVLSDIGEPDMNRQTYTGRTGIWPLNPGWQ